MSDKASGKEPDNRNPDFEDDDVTMPVGAEVPVDPEAGDQLDVVERWWDEEKTEDVSGAVEPKGKSPRQDETSKPLDDIGLPPRRREPLRPDDSPPEAPLELPNLPEVVAPEEVLREKANPVVVEAEREAESKVEEQLKVIEKEAVAEEAADEVVEEAPDEKTPDTDLPVKKEKGDSGDELDDGPQSKDSSEEDASDDKAASDGEPAPAEKGEDAVVPLTRPGKLIVPALSPSVSAGEEEIPPPLDEDVPPPLDEDIPPPLDELVDVSDKSADENGTEEGDEDFEGEEPEEANEDTGDDPGQTEEEGDGGDADEEAGDETSDAAESPEEEPDATEDSEEETGPDEQAESGEDSEPVEKDQESEEEEEETGESDGESEKSNGDSVSDPDDAEEKSGSTDDIDDLFGDSKPEVAAAAVATQKKQKSKRKVGCWTVFTTLFFLGSLLLFVVIAVAGFFGYQKFRNVEEELKNFAETKLAEEGIFLDYEGWSLNRFPLGLGLEGLTIYETEAKEKPQLRISDLALNTDFVGLIKDRKTGGTAEVLFDDSTVTFFENGEQVAELTGLDAEIIASRETLVIERLETVLGGLDIEGDGQIRFAKSGESGAGEGKKPDSGENGKKSPLDLDFSAMQELAAVLEFEANGAPPSLDIELEFDSENPGTMQLVARFDGEDFKWRGIPVSTATMRAALDPATKRIEIPTFQIGYGEGVIGGVLSFDRETKVLHITQLQSTVDLVALASDFNPEIRESLGMITMVDRPMVQVKGAVPLDNPSNAELEINYEQQHGISIASSSRELPVSNLRGILNFSRGALQTDSFFGRVLGGDVEINGATRLTAEEKPFSGLIEIKGMPLSEVAAYFGKADLGMTGLLHLDFRGVGYSDIQRIRGGGKVQITDSKLPAFPIIGPVQELLGKIIPAFGIQGEGTLDGAYLIESGVLLTNDMIVRQSGAELVTNGSIKLEHQTCDFTTVATLQPTLAKATGMEGKSITIAGDGPISEPSLKLKEFPIDFASGELNEILGTSPETLKELEGLLGDKEQAAKILGKEIEEATGVNLEEGINSLLDSFLGGGGEDESEEENGDQ